MKSFDAAVLFAAMLCAPAAQAARAAGAEAPPKASPSTAAAATAAAAATGSTAARPNGPPAAPTDDSASLRQGVVQDVSREGDRVLVNGSWLRVAEGTTVLFRQGRPASASVLRKGQLLRFTLARGAADRSLLGIVYVP